MASPAGLAGQFGLKTEATYGTAETVDIFPPGFLSEGVELDLTYEDSQAIRAGRLVNFAYCTAQTDIAGPVELELWNDDVATILYHCFGAVSTTGAGPYTHTYTPGDLESVGFTAQIGRPDIGGTVRAFTYSGCKVTSWTLSSVVGEIARLNLDLFAQAETTATGLATASYAASATPFCFVSGSLSFAGTEVAVVESFELTGDNMLDTGRHRIGSASAREPLQNGMREYTGNATVDFEDLTAYNRYVNGTEAAAVLAFDNGTDSLTVTMNVRWDGQTPTIGSANETLQHDTPWRCTSSTSDAAAITAVLVNGEASAA